MHVISIILFAIASSSDNFVIGLSYGAKRIKINLISNLIVSTISGVGTFIAMIFGGVFHNFIPVYASKAIGSITIILFGLYMLIVAFKNKHQENIEEEKNNDKYYTKVFKNPEIVDKNHSKVIEYKEAIVLGFILCLNNIGLGIAASIVGINIYAASLASLAFSIVFIPLGCYVGEKIIYTQLSRNSETIAAIIIILLGVYEIFI